MHVWPPLTSQNFYLEHPDVSKRTAEEIEEYRRKKDMWVILLSIAIEGRWLMRPPCRHACSHVYGDGVPKPVATFEEASFPS